MRIAIALLLALGCEKRRAPEPEVKASDPDAAAAAKEARSCPQGRCMAVPEGIRGLAFGMSREQASQVIGKLRRRPATRHRIKFEDCGERLPMPGERRVASTSIGEEEAQCELWFLSADESPDKIAGLAVIECDLDGRRTPDEHVETVWLLYRSLTRQYGQALSLSDQLTRRGRLKAMWQGPRAELILTAFRRGNRSSIEIVNRSPRYARSVELQLERVARRCQAEAAARAKERAEKEARLRERARKFEQDLRPPLERPQVKSDQD